MTSLVKVQASTATVPVSFTTIRVLGTPQTKSIKS